MNFSTYTGEKTVQHEQLVDRNQRHENLPESSSSNRSSGLFGTSSSPFPKARNLEHKSLKMSVLRLLGEFMPFYPMLMECG